MIDAAVRFRCNPVIAWIGLALVALALVAWQAWLLWPGATSPVYGTQELDRVVLLYSVLPRAVVAVLAGAALGLSGLLMQRVLRNPLAEPSTLGVSAGAQLMLTLAAVYAPAWLAQGREVVAFAGGIMAVGVILAMTWRRGLEPVSVVLAGMMIALTATSASAALILANGEYLTSLFIWGGGSLVQQSWAPARTISLWLIAGVLATGLMTRPLAVLALGDSSARGLGVAPGLLRLVLILIAVGLATVVVAQVGVIGFIGLAAPALATLSGARTLIQRLIAAPFVGAILLLLTDGLVQLIFTGSGERVPAGAATALLGGPLLLWLLPRLRMIEWPSLTARPSGIRRSRAPWRVIGALTIVAGVCAALAMMLGRAPAGWSFATGDLLVDLAALRGPRVIVALAAGCALAASGVVIQRVTGNPLASPEILGAGSGAGVGFAVVLFAMSAPGLGEQLVGSAFGAVVVLGVILAVARGSHFGPERVLFAGIAMGALCSAVLTAVIATGSREAFVLLRWISGSTNDAGPAHAWLAVIPTFVLVVPLLTMPRWLQILPLGDVTAASLGLPVRVVRLLLVLIAGLLAAVASLFVGPLSFIGLIAPHLARLLGLGRAQHQLVAALAIGAALMVMSDWLSRMVAFPYQLPLGLFASMLGGLYLIWLLGHGREQHG